MPLSLVIFDCDGVLIDSEAICNRVVATMLTEIGWKMTAQESHTRFIGLSFYDMQPLIETHLSRGLGVDWVDTVVSRVTAAMSEEVELVPGARFALDSVSAIGVPWRVASNSSHVEMDAKFRRTGLLDLVAGRVHSAVDVIALGGAGKPAPDIYLAAAAAEGVPPHACLAIEDSVAGVRAAIAAGMACFGYCPDDDGAHLRSAGARPFRSMHAMPDLLRAAMEAMR